MSLLRRLAGAAPVSVFVAMGEHLPAAVEDLLLHPGVRRAATPRSASVLLVAGRIRDADAQALKRVHDQTPHPRATLWWASAPLDGVAAPAVLDAAAGAEAAARKLRELHRGLLSDPGASEADWLTNEPPAPWQGQGEHGQGGKGMMGGKPYGRPMAMTADDLRDGLMLDAFTLRIGPFMPTLPPGLVLQLTLQGDVVQQAQVLRAALALPGGAGDVGDASRRASALRCIARLLDLLELPAYAERCRREAAHLTRGEAVQLRPLLQGLRRSAALLTIPPGLGLLMHESGGSSNGTDVRGRLQHWLLEAEAEADSESLIAGRSAARAVPVAELLKGLEWHEAMLVIASFEPAVLGGDADGGAPPHPPSPAAPASAAAHHDHAHALGERA